MVLSSNVLAVSKNGGFVMRWQLAISLLLPRSQSVAQGILVVTHRAACWRAGCLHPSIYQVQLRMPQRSSLYLWCSNSASPHPTSSSQRFSTPLQGYPALAQSAHAYRLRGVACLQHSSMLDLRSKEHAVLQ